MRALAAFVLLAASAPAGADEPPARPDRPAPAAARSAAPVYWPSARCGGCHPRTLDQQLQSHHERAFTNPLFQAQYFELLLPRASREPELAGEARTCSACHAPVASANARSATRAMIADPSLSGVTCDVCHTIRGVDGTEPRNGNYLSSPSDVKFGPMAGSDNAHHVFAPIISRSELCGTCHEATNHHGLTVKATYSEWRASPAARAGLQCQDCHMTRDGLVRAAAAGSEGLVRYTHRFPGAHSRSQVDGAVRLALTARVAAAGARRLVIQVAVDNGKSGHRYPTGSTDLRLLWLEVTAHGGERVLPVPCPEAGPGVAGQGKADESLLGPDVPPGSRIYRAVFVDGAGSPTFQSWDARRIAFDNRLPAGAVVKEEYALDLPKDLAGPLRIEAKLRYLAYPSSFAKLMDLAPAAPVDVAVASVELPGVR